jgi:hypothetical protein
MEKERGMEERSATPALQEFPQLSLLHFLRPQNQDLVKDYLVYIRARRYGPVMQEGTIRALKNSHSIDFSGNALRPVRLS